MRRHGADEKPPSFVWTTTGLNNCTLSFEALNNTRTCSFTHRLKDSLNQ